MAKINDTTTFPATAPALGDHFPGTDISNTGNDANGETVTFTMQAVMDLFEANFAAPASALSSGTLDDARVAESNVTQHQAALAVTESQISDLGSYLTGITGESIASLSDVTLTSPVQGHVVYHNGSAWVNLGPGTSGQFLQTQGAGANPQWATASGSGDVSKVGTPADSQIGVWTGDGTIEGASTLTYGSSVLEFTGGLLLNERADHAATPGAGKAELWVSNDTTQKLYMTDDAGTDKEVAFVTGGTDLSSYTGVLGLNSGTAVDVNSKTLLEARIGSVDLALATGDIYAGSHDFGGADDLEIPNSATPTVDTDGQVAIDTTVTDWSHGVLEYYSGEVMGVVAMPIAQFTSPTGGYVVAYNATNDEFELVSQAGGGDMSASTYDPGAVGEQLVGLTASQTLTNKQLTAPQFNTSFTFDAVTFTGVTGADTDVVSGTAGSNGYLVMWNGDGDAVDSTVAASDVVTLTGTETLTNKTLTDPKVSHSYNAQTGTSYTLVLGDANKVVSMSNASANTLTIPPNSSVAFPTGTIITVFALGAGTTTIAGGTGVTLSGNGGSGSAYSADIQTQYNAATIIKIGTDSWLISGDIDAVAA